LPSSITSHSPSQNILHSSWKIRDIFGILVDVCNKNHLVVKCINQLVGMVNIVERGELVVVEGRDDLDELNVSENLD
jgi:hypothetical protein